MSLGLQELRASPTRAGRFARACACALRRHWRVAAYAVAALTIARIAVQFDAPAARATLQAAGPVALLALLPFGLEVALEAESWRLLLGAFRHRVLRLVAWRVTLFAEAVRLGVPGGPPVADGLRPVLFGRHGGAPLTDGAAVLAVRKLSHMGTQGLFLVAGAALGAPMFAAWGARLGPVGAMLRPATWAAGVALALGASLLVLLLLHGSLITRAERLLARLGGARLASVLERRRAACAALDDRLRALLGRSPALLCWSAATAATSWLLEAAETWILLRVLGAPAGWREAIALEALASALRVLAFAAPGGLGIQDLGYHALVRGLAGDGAAMGFVLLKRGRDLVWLLAGFLLAPRVGRLEEARRAVPAVLGQGGA